MLARARRALSSPRTRGIPDPRSVGRIRSRPAAGGEHDHGGHPGTRRRHRSDRCSAAARRPAPPARAAIGVRLSGIGPAARHARLPGARRACSPPASASWSPCGAPRAPSARSRIVLFNFPPERRQHRHRRLSVGVRVAARARLRAMKAAGYRVDAADAVSMCCASRSSTAMRVNSARSPTCTSASRRMSMCAASVT